MGRDEELSFLMERYKLAERGSGSLIILEGEAGIGKSRLVSEFLESAGPSRARQAIAYCLEHVQSPLGPILDLFQTLRIDSRHALPEASSVRQIITRLSNGIEAPRVSSEGDDPRAQYEALSEAFRRFSNEKPISLVIEDVQWSDRSSIEFLKFLSSRLRGMSVMFLITRRTRDAELSDAFALARTVLTRRPNVHVVELGPLPRRQVRTILKVALQGQIVTSPERLRSVEELADGNPLFAEELLGHAIDEHTSDEAFPLSLRALLLDQMSRLEPGDRETLTLAAVLGRRFDATFLSELTGEPIDRILMTLRRAREERIVIEERGDEGPVAFRHPLIREMLYAMLLTSEARRLHRRIAEMIERLPQSSTHVTELAYHWWSARDWGRALYYNRLAGSRAMAMLAPNDAAVMFERALNCTAEADPEWPILQRQLGDALSQSGLSGRAKAAYEAAIGAFKESGDNRTVAELSLLIGTASTGAAANEDAVVWHMAGLKAAETLPADPIWFAAHARVALFHALRGDVNTANVLLDRASQFNGQRSPKAQVDFFDARATACVLAGDWLRAEADYREAADVAKESRSATLLVRAHCNWASAAVAVGEIESALSASRNAVRLSEEASIPLYRAYALAIAGRAHLAAGDHKAALSLLKTASRFADGLDSARPHSQLVILGLSLGARMSRHHLISEHLDYRALDAAFSSTEHWWIGSVIEAFVEAEISRGRLQNARELLDRTFKSLKSVGSAPGIACLASEHAEGETVSRARELLAAWAENAGNRTGQAYLVLFDGYVNRRAGADAAPMFLRAAELFLSFGMPYRAEVARRALAEPSPANGASALKTPRVFQDAGEAALATLSAREREVLLLVAKGRSNKDISRLLSVSHRTVESHVRSILAKYGVSSRVELLAQLVAMPGSVQSPDWPFTSH